MRVRCLHGYFIFEETRVGQVSDFMSYTGLSLVPKGPYYTFESLENAPNYSLAGKELLLGVNAIETFEGPPWEVFEANGMIYDFTTDTLKPILSVAINTQLQASGNRYISPGFLLPGSVIAGGQRIKNFDGYWSRESFRWLYSEVTFV